MRATLVWCSSHLAWTCTAFVALLLVQRYPAPWDDRYSGLILGAYTLRLTQLLVEFARDYWKERIAR